VRGTHSFHTLQRQQGALRMEDPEPLFTERWHYTVPPYVRCPVFALQRDPNSGKTRESTVRVNQWESAQLLSNTAFAWAGGGSRRGSGCLAW
jgi:hypothetical protein